MQELFQLFGELGLRTNNAFREIDRVESRVRELARNLEDQLTADVRVNDLASDSLEDIGSASDQARLRLAQLEDVVRSVQDQLDGDFGIDIDGSDIGQTRNDLRELMQEVNRVRRNLDDNIDVSTLGPALGGSNRPSPVRQISFDDTQQELSSLQSQLEEVQQQLNSLEAPDINFNGVRTNVNGLISSLGTVESEMERITAQMDAIDANRDENGNVSQEQQVAYDNLSAEIQRLNSTMTALTAATLASAAGTAGPGGLGRGVSRNQGYDLDQVFREQLRMNQMMLRYAERMNPVNSVGRARMRMDVGSNALSQLPIAETQLQLQALFGMAEAGMQNARQQLVQIGFGKTKAEVKALEAQLHSMANIRMDTLKDNIKLTEKALKDMKSSANADELVDEIARAESSLAKFRDELKNNPPVVDIARVNGMNAEEIFGKDVLVKPFKTQIEKVGGMLDGFFNKDVAKLMNTAYTTIDNAAKAIVGAQTSKAEEKAKIMQLQTAYQNLGMRINTFVTPAVAGLAAAFALVGKNGEDAASVFGAQTLTATEDMGEFKDMMTDVGVATGASGQEVGELFSVLHNQMGKTKETIAESAEMGLRFKDVWKDIDAVEAISAVDGIAEELGVSTKQAQDIMALALKKHQGNIQSATKDVMAHGDAWKDASKKGSEGADAYETMVNAMDEGAIARFMTAFRQMGAALLELWQQLEPTLTKIAKAITAAAEATTEWLRENPGMAKFAAHVLAIGAAVTVLVGALAPVAGFLLLHRNLFQGLAQAMTAAGRGGTAVLNPAVRMVIDSMTMMKNAVMGLPRILAGVFPAMAAMLRTLPAALGGAILNFVKMNPLLAAFGALTWVVQKNWERFQPIFERIWDSLKRIGEAIFGAFAGPGGDAADGFGNLLDKIAKIAGDILVPVLEVVAKMVEALAVVMENGGGKIVAIVGAIWLFGGALGKMLPFLSGAGGALTGFFGIFAAIGPKIMKFVSFIKKIGPAIRIAALAMTGPWGIAIAAIAGGALLIYKNWSKIKDFFEKLDFKKIGKALAEGLMLGLQILANWSPAGLIWQFVVKPIMKALGINSPSKLFMKFGRWLIEGLVIGIKKGFQLLSGIFEPLAGLFRRVFTRLTSITRSAARGISRAFLNALRGLSKIASSALNGVSRVFSRVWGTIRRVTRSTWSGIRNFLRSVWGSIRRVATSTFNAIRRAVTNAWNSIRRVTRSVWNSIRNFIRTVTRSIRNIIVNAFNAIKKKVTDILNALKKFIIAVWTAIRNFIRNAVNTIKRIITQAFNAIKRTIISVLNSVKTSIRNAFNYIISRARSFAKTFKSVLKGMWNSLKNLAKDAWSWGKDIISGLIGGISSMMGKLASTVSGVASTVKSGVKDALGIRSPSRVMKGFGRNVGEGLIIGIDSMVKKVGKASNRLSDAIKGPESSRSFDRTGNSRGHAITGPRIDAKQHVVSGVRKAMGSYDRTPAARVKPTITRNNTVNHNNTSTKNNYDRGVSIQQATFEVKVEKLHNADDITKLRKNIQNVVSNDLFGRAVRNR
jgi:phage-related protein